MKKIILYFLFCSSLFTIQSSLFAGELKITTNNSKYKKQSSFDVLDLNIEQIGPNTNHELLYKISDLSGGNVFYPNEIQRISKNLNLNDKQSIIQLVAPNRFVQDWVNDKYFSRIRQLVAEFSDQDTLDVVIENARQSGVMQMLNVCLHLEQIDTIVEPVFAKICAPFPSCYDDMCSITSCTQTHLSVA